MTFEDFKKAAKETGYPFTNYFETDFFKPRTFVAEIQSHVNHATIYCLADGSATLVTGWGPDRKIEHFKNIQDIRRK